MSCSLWTPPGLERVLETLSREGSRQALAIGSRSEAPRWRMDRGGSATGGNRGQTGNASPAGGLAALFALISVGLAVLGGLVQASQSFHPSEPVPDGCCPENVTFRYYLSVSPDGRKLVFSATGKDGLWIRDFSTLGLAAPPWNRRRSGPAFLVSGQSICGVRRPKPDHED